MAVWNDLPLSLHLSLRLPLSPSLSLSLFLSLSLPLSLSLLCCIIPPSGQGKTIFVWRGSAYSAGTPSGAIQQTKGANLHWGTEVHVGVEI